MIYIILIIITIFVYLIYKSVKNKPEKAKQVNVKEILHTAQENKKKILDKCKNKDTTSIKMRLIWLKQWK